MIETELIHYGYLFVFIGTIFEGDATLLAAAFLAHRGYFRFSWVLIVAALTTWLATQVYFLVARRAGIEWLETVGVGTTRLPRIFAWLTQYGGLLVFASRFMIGFRTLIPVVAGASKMDPVRFFVWNAVGAMAWAAAFGWAGYFGGHVLTMLVDDIRHHEKAIAFVATIGIAALIMWRTHGADVTWVWRLRNVIFASRS